MNDDRFSIQIDDNSGNFISEITVEENNKFIQLYDWQQRAIEYFLKHKKAVFEVATGAGKSFCAIQIMKEIMRTEPNIKVLIVVPKNIILEDTWFRELYDAGYSLRNVGVYYSGIHEYAQITITNMQNLAEVNLEIFDMLIADECFSGNMKVLCENNKIYKIEDIVNKKLKIKVLSYNIKTKKLEYKKILNYYKIKDKREVLDIELENGKILTVTQEQLIYNGKEYIKACNLNINDKILSK